MANNLKDHLKEVADAIRAKKGTSDLINPQDFATEIEGITSGSGGESGGSSTIEYLDVSDVSSLVKASVVQYAIYVKALAEAYDAKFAGVTLFVLSAMTDNPIEATSAIAIDFVAETIIDMGGSSTKMTIADAVLQNGATQADIDSIPRLTKEQFYDLNA